MSRVKEREATSWTAATREYLVKRLPADNLLPDRQPYYVGSWVYVFGVVTIASLVWVVLSGVVLTFFQTNQAVQHSRINLFV